MLCLTLRQTHKVIINHESVLEVLVIRPKFAVVEYETRRYLLNLKENVELAPNIKCSLLKFSARGSSFGLSAPRDVTINRAKVEASKMEGTNSRRSKPESPQRMDTRPVHGLPEPSFRPGRTQRDT